MKALMLAVLVALLAACAPAAPPAPQQEQPAEAEQPAAEEEAAGLDDIPFIRQLITDEPYHIKVPKLTRKERLYLDKRMPCDDGWVPELFELEANNVQNYRDVYRYYPMYAELLL